MKCWISVICLMLIILFSCNENNIKPIDKETVPYDPTPAFLKIPEIFRNLILPPIIPESNQLTEEGIALGKKLFHDPILSRDSSMACASCHFQNKAFTDSVQFSVGVSGIHGARNSMPLFNLAWNFNQSFFWDGRTSSLEEQAERPVVDRLELDNTWPNVIESLMENQEYKDMFYAAFGVENITKELTTKAIAQFERTLISANSRFDQFLRGDIVLTPEETSGFLIFMSEEKGDCFHCHGSNNNPLWTDNDFHNNGLDSVFEDLGLGFETGLASDNGKFKTPSLRNLSYSAPYMHDGRFETLEQVIDHYSEGLQFSSTIDPLMKNIEHGGVQLTVREKSDLMFFLLSLNDESFVTNPDFAN